MIKLTLHLTLSGKFTIVHDEQMDWTRRNIGTLTLIAFATAAFLTELSGAFPQDGLGAELAKVALIALAAARGLVSAAEALGGNTPAPPTQDDDTKADS